MKAIVLLITLTLSVAIHAEAKEFVMDEWNLTYVSDSSLTNEEAIYEVEVLGFNIDEKTKIHYSFNDFETKVTLDAEGKFRVKTTPKKGKFSFLLDRSHYEIFTDSIELKAGHVTKIQLWFRRANRGITVKKPVIYLYPESTTDVSVEMKVKGDLTFTYPEYREGWNVTAHPNGNLEHSSGTFNYLFWEADHNYQPAKDFHSKGFVVSSDDVVSFLEHQLKGAGLNSQERADFITFWGPQLVKHENVYLHFLFNDQCNQFASLNVSPKPDEVYRIYLIWSTEIPANRVVPQAIPSMKREGFSVLEWGGAEL